METSSRGFISQKREFFMEQCAEEWQTTPTGHKNITSRIKENGLINKNCEEKRPVRFPSKTGISTFATSSTPNLRRG
jgi:hypothetical protein